jgi:hypothetical protein
MNKDKTIMTQCLRNLIEMGALKVPNDWMRTKTLLDISDYLLDKFELKE